MGNDYGRKLRGVGYYILLILLVGTFSCQFDSKKNIKKEKANFVLAEDYKSPLDSIKDTPKKEDIRPVNIDLEKIKKRGKLVALTGYSYTSYFIYRGTPMGYEYELLQRLADHLDVELEIEVVKDMDDIYKKLNRGEGDIIADNITVTSDLLEKAAVTVPCNTSRQVLVQRKGGKDVIRNPLELIGKEVYVRKGSAYHQRLKNLSSEIGGEIIIKEVSGDIENEELIKKVATGEIDYTVADEHLAMYNKTWHPNLDVQTAISFPQRVAWAVRKNSPELLKEVNSWLKGMKQKTTWYVIYNRYFNSNKTIKKMVNCSRKSTCGNKISPYDDIIIDAADSIGWDWRLLTSIIYQESRFDPKAKSWAGATGLMQLMPRTAEAFGVKDATNPMQSLKGGTKYLKWLENYWQEKIPDTTERVKFILASYNAGQGHVADAQRLAEKYGKDPHKWEDVAHFLLLKSKDKYKNDPVVRYGYCRGEEPVNYVREILERHAHYKKLIQQDIYLASNS